MKNRICFLSDEEIYQWIKISGYEAEYFDTRFSLYLKKLTEKAELKFSPKSVSSDLQKLDGDVIITLGHRSTRTLLMLPKSRNVKELLGLEQIKDDKIIIPWYSISHLLMRGKSLQDQTINLFSNIGKKYGNGHAS